MRDEYVEYRVKVIVGHRAHAAKNYLALSAAQAQPDSAWAGRGEERGEEGRRTKGGEALVGRTMSTLRMYFPLSALKVGWRERALVLVGSRGCLPRAGLAWSSE